MLKRIIRQYIFFQVSNNENNISNNESIFKIKDLFKQLFKDEKSIKIILILIILSGIFHQGIKIGLSNVSAFSLLTYFSYTNSINDFIFISSFILLTFCVFFAIIYCISIIITGIISIILSYFPKIYKIFKFIIEGLIVMGPIIYLIYYTITTHMNKITFLIYFTFYLLYLISFFAYILSSYKLSIKIKTFKNIFYSYFLLTFLLLTFGSNPTIGCRDFITKDTKNINNICIKINYKNDKYIFTDDAKVYQLSDFKTFYSIQSYNSMLNEYFSISTQPSGKIISNQK